MTSVNSYCGRVEDVLPDLASNSADGGLCDSPYGIKFLCKDWDAQVPPPSVWAEVYRVLKPGAFFLAFIGTRTWHRLATSMEEGGFDICDTLMWLNGQGFPKSKNIGLLVDKAHGGPNRGHAIAVASTNHPTTGKARPHGTDMGRYIARTKAGQPWEGYGSGLKPAWEPIILARKPRDGTYANNAQKWGCGGLNIEACRVGDHTCGTCGCEAHNEN